MKQHIILSFIFYRGNKNTGILAINIPLNIARRIINWFLLRINNIDTWNDVTGCYMSSNGQTHFKNLAANAGRFLKCVWPFYDIAK